MWPLYLISYCHDTAILPDKCTKQIEKSLPIFNIDLYCTIPQLLHNSVYTVHNQLYVCI